MHHSGFINKLNRTWLAFALPILVILCTFIAIRLDKSMPMPGNDRDFLPFWLAGNMIMKGENPYDANQWAAGYSIYETSLSLNPAFLYPLPLALLFAPLGKLPFHSAYIIWITLTQLMIIFSLAILLSLEKSPRAKLFFVPLLAGIVLFRPTILTLTQGQVSGLFLFVLVWIGFFWQRGQWFPGGLLLGLLVLKPNLGVPIIGLVAIWLFLQKRWRAIFGILVSGIFLLIIGFVNNPAWVMQYWHVGSNKLTVTFGGSPTVWGLGALISHNQTGATLIIGGLAGLLVLLGFFRTVLRSRTSLQPVSVLALAVTVTLLVTPYTWTYDQLLLVLPISLVTLAMNRMGVRFLLSSIIFLGMDALVIVMLFFDAALQVEILNVVIPALVYGLCLWWLPRGVPAGSGENLHRVINTTDQRG